MAAQFDALADANNYGMLRLRTIVATHIHANFTCWGISLSGPYIQLHLLQSLHIQNISCVFL